jgi:polysaccharide pyruvyl transferase WcaK-like protein
VRAVQFPDFPAARAADAMQTCQAIVSGVTCEPWQPGAAAGPGGHLVACIAAADGVLFCGAGNLCSAFADRLYERIATARLAAAMAKPYAFIGQTVGPLSDADAAQLRPALAGAVFAGTRDPASAELLGRLGVPAVRMQDDAMQAPAVAPTAAPDSSLRIGVTLHRSPLAQYELDMPSTADAIGRVARQTGATVRFIPHFRGPNGRWSDMECGAQLASALQVPVEFAPWGPVDKVRADTAACSLVISTRYHPLVFAACAGIPAVGIYQDSYHRAKFSGVRGGRETSQRIFLASRDSSDLVAAAGVELLTGSPVSEAESERHRLMIEQDAVVRRSCLVSLGCQR